jgi:hypothetical protein
MSEIGKIKKSIQKAKFLGLYRYVTSDALVDIKVSDIKISFKKSCKLQIFILFIVILIFLNIRYIFNKIQLPEQFFLIVASVMLLCIIWLAWSLRTSKATLFVIDLHRLLLEKDGLILNLSGAIAVVEVMARNCTSAEQLVDDKSPPNFSSNNYLFLLIMSSDIVCCVRLLKGESPNAFMQITNLLSQKLTIKKFVIDALPEGYLKKFQVPL